MLKIAKALDRMSELSVLARDVTKPAADIALYQTEFAAQAAFVNDLSTRHFNGITLQDGNDRAVTVDSEGAVFTLTGIRTRKFRRRRPWAGQAGPANPH